jgi:hypothetical protein
MGESAEARLTKIRKGLQNVKRELEHLKIEIKDLSGQESYRRYKKIVEDLAELIKSEPIQNATS